MTIHDDQLDRSSVIIYLTTRKTVMAGKGFTVKKDWDNPREHAMPAEARVPAEVRLGSVLVAPATVLAPMAGVTDTVFRRFIRHASLFTQGSGIRDQNRVRGQGLGDGDRER